jgi:amidase
MHFFVVLFTAVKLIRAQRSSSPNTSDFGAAQVLQNPFPYDFPHMDASPVALFPMPSCHGITLEEATIDQLQDAMSHGKLTSVDILNCYLARVTQTNTYCKYGLLCLLMWAVLTRAWSGVLELNPDAASIAASLDVERDAGRVRGPLHGIPLLVKDNIATKDKMDTTAGSWMLVGSIVPRDAHVVSRLRNAGALLMGHATLSEWADMRSNNVWFRQCDYLRRLLTDA